MTSMRTLLLPLLFVALTGCLDVDTRISVTFDGSGTITERMVLKGPMAQMMQQMGGENAGLTDREQVEAHARELGEGVRVVSVKELPKSEGLGAEAVFAFRDVTKLHMQQNPVDGREGPPGAAPPTKRGEGKGGEMRFRFESGSPSVLTVLLDQGRGTTRGGERKSGEAPASKPDPATDAMARKMMEGFKEMMGGMRMAISVEVDGTIIETNATYRDGNRITLLELEIDKLLEADPKSAMKLQPGVDLDAMKQAIAGVPGVKVELEPEVRVVFKPGSVLVRRPLPPPELMAWRKSPVAKD